MLASLRINWTILRVSIEERLIYRVDFAVATLLRFLPIITTILLWQAIYTSSGSDTVAGYRYGDMVAYYLLAMITRAFSSMPGLASGIAREIRDGSIKRYLIQPVDLVGYLFWTRVAHKLVYYGVALGPFALVFWLFRSYFPGWPDGWTIAAYLLALALSFALGFLFHVLLGLIAFWFLEVTSLLFIVMSLEYFLSGHMFPLDLLPAGVARVFEWMPFQYFAYWPAVVLLGRLSHPEIAEGLLIEALWVVVLMVAVRIVYARGLRRYSAFGG